MKQHIDEPYVVAAAKAAMNDVQEMQANCADDLMLMTVQTEHIDEPYVVAEVKAAMNDVQEMQANCADDLMLMTVQTEHIDEPYVVAEVKAAMNDVQEMQANCADDLKLDRRIEMLPRTHLHIGIRPLSASTQHDYELCNCTESAVAHVH